MTKDSTPVSRNGAPAAALARVRALLSGPEAAGFFEAWAAAAERRRHGEERRLELEAQAASATARAHLLEQVAERDRERAAEQRRRHAAAAGPERAEAEALVELWLARAEARLAEARVRHERARRAGEEAAAARADRDEADRALAALRPAARAFGALPGEACLFFEVDADPAALYVVPLEHLPAGTGGAPLDAFVLHRLAHGAPLRDAVPLRDAPPLHLPDLPEDEPTLIDDLAPAAPAAAATRGEEKP